jgi:hypothetical protein
MFLRGSQTAIPCLLWKKKINYRVKKKARLLFHNISATKVANNNNNNNNNRY